MKLRGEFEHHVECWVRYHSEFFAWHCLVWKVVLYEEFSPFGTTTYNAASSLQGNKRYRFSAKERDSESGLYYFENRYYMPWLGRWLEPDPIGTKDGPNGKFCCFSSRGKREWNWLANNPIVYCYVRNDPVNNVDPTGLMLGEQPRDIHMLISLYLEPSDVGHLKQVNKAFNRLFADRLVEMQEVR